jgi:hypothetical protein
MGLVSFYFTSLEGFLPFVRSSVYSLTRINSSPKIRVLFSKIKKGGTQKMTTTINPTKNSILSAPPTGRF